MAIWHLIWSVYFLKEGVNPRRDYDRYGHNMIFQNDTHLVKISLRTFSHPSVKGTKKVGRFFRKNRDAKSLFI